MRGRQQQPADVRQIKPQRELSPEHTAMLAITTSGYDLHTTQSVALGCAQERSQGKKRLLCRQAMQIEFARTGEVPAAKLLPAGAIDAWRLSANAQRRRPSANTRRRRHYHDTWRLRATPHQIGGCTDNDLGIGRRDGSGRNCTAKWGDPLGITRPLSRIDLG
jgi:hypothetical protein